MKFSIWAPRAKKVELCSGNARHPLHPEDDGFWSTDIEIPAEGMRYRYSVDGGPPLPDPLSRWQPDGVHGDSWAGAMPALPPPLQTSRPLAKAVIYEMHVGTFTAEGTYAAARGRLSHLVQLGITHVELMPLATFPGRHGWGYDGTYWFAPHPAYGTPAELAEFVGACHELGLAVLLDVVYNHLGPDGNYLPAYGPCFSERPTLWGQALNFDGADSDGIRRLVRENATLWLRDYGFDGLRLDAVHAILDQRATPILEELAVHVHALSQELQRPLVLIAESDLHDPRLVQATQAGGYGLDAFWADDFHHAVHRLLTGESHGYYADFDGGLPDVARAIHEGYVYQGQFSPSRKRAHGRPPGATRSDQFVFCIQNHDQVGNRAGGERLTALVSPEKAKAAAALLLLAPQVPLLFQGEEWGARTPFLYFTDHVDSKLGEAVTEGRRREFPGQQSVSDPQDPHTYQQSRLNWVEAAKAPHTEIFEWYRELIAFRQCCGPECYVRFDPQAKWLVLDRGDVCAAFNFADVPQKIPSTAGAWRLALASTRGGEPGLVPAAGVRVYVRENS